MKWIRDCYNECLNYLIFLKSYFLSFTKSFRKKIRDKSNIFITCPHCKESNKLNFTHGQLSLGLAQFTFNCNKCKNMMVVLIVDRSVIIATAKADKKFRLEELGCRLVHSHKMIMMTLFQGGVPPDDEQKFLAYMEAMENLTEEIAESITIEEVQTFSNDLSMTNCPTDEELFGKK